MNVTERRRLTVFSQVKERAIGLAQAGRLLGLSEGQVRRLIQRRRQTGSLAPRPPQFPDNTILKEYDLVELAALMAQKPDLTLEELAAALTKKFGIATVYRAAVKIRHLFTKKSLHAAEQKRPDVQVARAVWFEGFRHMRLDQLVFLMNSGPPAI